MPDDKGCDFCMTGERDIVLRKWDRKGTIHVRGLYSCSRCMAEKEARKWLTKNLDPIMVGVDELEGS